MTGPNNKRPEFADDRGVGSRCLDLLEKIAVRFDPKKQKVDNLQRLALTDAERLQAEADGLISYQPAPVPYQRRYRYTGPKTPAKFKPKYDNITDAVNELLATPAPWPWGICHAIASKHKVPRTSLHHRLKAEMEKRGLETKHFRHIKSKKAAA